MRPTKSIAAALALAFSLACGAVACEEKGALEKAGESMDEAVDDITHPGEGTLEKAGRKTDEKLDSMKESLKE